MATMPVDWPYEVIGEPRELPFSPEGDLRESAIEQD
jgi:hypothetical protein